jgi:hypothetical protein
MPATLAARCPGSWRTWAKASAAIGFDSGATRARMPRQMGATNATEAASQSAMAA